MSENSVGIEKITLYFVVGVRLFIYFQRGQAFGFHTPMVSFTLDMMASLQASIADFLMPDFSSMMAIQSSSPRNRFKNYPDKDLKKRTEIVAICRHQSKHFLMKFCVT